MSRYLLEKVAKQPTMRRIKDAKRKKYIKKPHGDDLWNHLEAEQMIAELSRQQENNA